MSEKRKSVAEKQAGETIGPYKVVRLLGEGTFSKVRPAVASEITAISLASSGVTEVARIRRCTWLRESPPSRERRGSRCELCTLV